MSKQIFKRLGFWTSITSAIFTPVFISSTPYAADASDIKISSPPVPAVVLPKSSLPSKPPLPPSHSLSADVPAKSPKSDFFHKGFADTVAPLLPAVVNISIIKKVTTYSLQVPPGMQGGEGMGGMGAPGGSPLEDLFRYRDFLEQFELAPKKRRVPVGVGSGFIISAAGHVVTNAHVVDGAHEVIVTLADQSELKATILGVDARADLALLKINAPRPLPFVEWGDASKVRAGDWSIAIGNPLGLGGTVTLGIISHVSRSFAMQQPSIGGFFQTDAPINVGNSGGPLFNCEGKVIGVNMMIASSTGGSIGIGFSIPSDVAQFVIEQLKIYGRVKRGWIGVQIQPLNQEIAKSLKLKTPQGALVGSIVENSPAEKAGILQADVILKVNGFPVEDSSKLIKIVGSLPIGTKVPLTVWRKSSQKEVGYEEIILYVVIEEYTDLEEPAQKIKGSDAQQTQDDTTLYGLTVQELSPTWRKKYNLSDVTSGLLVTKVDPESRAAECFQPGDVILEMNQEKVVAYKDLEKQIKIGLEKKQTSILCLIQRQTTPFFVALSLEPVPDDAPQKNTAPKKASSFLPFK